MKIQEQRLVYLAYLKVKIKDDDFASIEKMINRTELRNTIIRAFWEGLKYSDLTYEKKKRIESLEKAVFGEDTNVEEIEKEEKVEMSRDMVTSLVEEVEELKSQIVKLEKQPGAEGFKHNPEATNRKKEKVNLGKLSTQERVAYFMSNNNN